MSYHIPSADTLFQNIDNFELHWIFGFGYYVLAFEKTDKTPEVNVNLQIPGKDFEDNWRIRAERNAQKNA